MVARSSRSSRQRGGGGPTGRACRCSTEYAASPSCSSCCTIRSASRSNSSAASPPPPSIASRSGSRDRGGAGSICSSCSPGSSSLPSSTTRSRRHTSSATSGRDASCASSRSTTASSSRSWSPSRRSVSWSVAAVDEVRDHQVWYWTYLVNTWSTLRATHGHIPIVHSHLWSLAVEEQFYLISPAVVLLLARRQPMVLCPAIVASSRVLRAYLRS